MVKRFTPLAGSVDQDREVLFHTRLSDQIGQEFRSQCLIQSVFGFRLRCD
jgi:hypothetical protein